MVLSPNRQAFLDTIALSELGAALLAVTENGYNVMVGSTPDAPILFDSYDDHPHIVNPQFKSSAAGRYQILARNFDFYKIRLRLPDFSPEAQDAIAIQQISERHALDPIDAGNFDTAIARCNNIWASFAGSKYGQRTNSLDQLRAWFVKSGGTIHKAGFYNVDSIA